MRFVLAWCAGAMLLLGIARARAETKVLVDYGWQQNFQPDTWTPVYLTVWDPDLPAVGRRARLEITVPGSLQGGMDIALTLHIGAEQENYVAYVPLRSTLSQVRLRLTDADTGKKLYEASLVPDTGFGASYYFPQSKTIIARAGSHGGAQIRLESLANGQATVVNPRLEDLPETAAGFAGFAALMLDEPEFSRLTPRRQEAIVDWVRAGGALVFQPGDEAPPGDSPLLKILPGKIGFMRTLELSPEVRQRAGLPERFKKIVAYDLTPDADAQRSPLLGGGKAYFIKAQRGLGEVAMLSFSASELLFDQESQAAAFWTPVFASVMTGQSWIPGSLSGEPSQSQYAMQESAPDAAQTAAAGGTSRTMDALGDIPGVGSFDFKYVVIVLAALMLVVGPIDWLVLRKLKRLEWTWLTTATWIVLVTFGALYIGHIFRSGKLYFRTLKLVDQACDPRGGSAAAGHIVASTSVVCIYSPQTQYYALSTPGGWWRPMQMASYAFDLKAGDEIPFAQDLEADTNRPLPAPINVWNLRFFQSEGPEGGEPVVAAKLTLSAVPPPGAREGQGEYLQGTITNLSDRPLGGLHIRVRGGAIALTDVVRPHATVQVNARVNPNDRFGHPNWPAFEGNYYPGRYYGPAVSQNPGGGHAPSLIEAAASLSARRWTRVEGLLQNEPAAVIYAEWMNAPPAAALVDPPPQKQENWEFVRAVVKLSNSEAQR